MQYRRIGRLGLLAAVVFASSCWLVHCDNVTRTGQTAARSNQEDGGEDVGASVGTGTDAGSDEPCLYTCKIPRVTAGATCSVLADLQCRCDMPTVPAWQCGADDAGNLYRIDSVYVVGLGPCPEDAGDRWQARLCKDAGTPEAGDSGGLDAASDAAAD